MVTGGVAGQAFQRVNVEHAEQGRITGLELRERIWTYAELYPRSLTTVVIETNNGGLWREVLGAYETPIDKMLSLPPQRGRLETRAG